MLKGYYSHFIPLPVFSIKFLIFAIFVISQIFLSFSDSVYSQDSHNIQNIVSMETTKPLFTRMPSTNIKLSPNIGSQPNGLLHYFGPKPPAINAATLFSTIEAFNFDDNGSETGFVFIPPDPIGVAGPNHLVAVVNVMIDWYLKDGTRQFRDALQDFFAPLSPLTFTFDPKVIYDQYEDRFVVVTLEQTAVADGDPANTSRILLAVSDDANPNGTWHFHAINSMINIGFFPHWADYPGFAVDEEAVYITCNMFPFLIGVGGVRLWIVDKGVGSGGFYDGGSASVTVHNPYASAANEATTQPAHVFGSGGVGPGIGNFLVSYSGFTDGTNEAVQVVRVDDPLGSPSFTQEFVPVGNIDNTSISTLPDAPQSGTSDLIEVNDRRALHAVWRNNELWMTTTILPNSGPDVNQTTAHWFKLNTSAIPSPITLADQGNIGGEDIASGTYTFFPSVAVDQNGNAGFGFSASASTIFAGAYYTGRLSSDPAGTVQSSGTLRAGQDFYLRTFGGERNRWGDYSGMSVDPSDDLTFWVFNEYALMSGSGTPPEDGRWGTAFGSFRVAGQSVSPGDIIITEIMKDPDAVLDANGEWFEIYNPTGSAIDINGWTIRDNGSDTHTITGGPHLVPALDFFVLGIDTNTSSNGGYTGNYEYSNFDLDNGIDEVVIEDLTSTIIDEVDYDAGITFPNPSGASIALTNFLADNNVGSNWATSSARQPSYQGSAGDKGSPGTLGIDQALPVTLTSFTANSLEDRVILQWITESEIMNVGFKIMRKLAYADSYFLVGSYETHHELLGQLNSNTQKEYRFEDEEVVPGMSYGYKLVDVDVFGTHVEHGPIWIKTAIDNDAISSLPKSYKLYPNFPNPFNPHTTIRFQLPQATITHLAIYNLLGEEIETLIFNDLLAAGEYETIWEPIGIPSGLYFMQLTAYDAANQNTKLFTDSKKLILQK